MDNPLCYCGNPARFNKNKKEWGEYCSPGCANRSPKSLEKRRQTNLLKYGVDNPAKNRDVINKMKNTLRARGEEDISLSNSKRKTTNTAKYGVGSVSQVEDFKKKAKKTNIEKYGVSNPAQSKEIQDKIVSTNMDRYGTKAPAMNKDVQTKISKTNMEKYGFTTNLQTPEFKGSYQHAQKLVFYNSLMSGYRLQNKVIPLFTFEEYSPQREKYYEYPWECCICKTQFSYYLENGTIPRCPQCYPSIHSGSSEMERELVAELGKNFVTMKERDKDAVGVELDIYIPSKKVAIEFNGIYWHSESRKPDKAYHLNKTNLCRDKGINLIHIFEWQWVNSRNIVMSIILNRLGISQTRLYARKLLLKEVSLKQEKTFLTESHIQGYTPSSICLGLFTLEGELVQISSFGKPRFTNKYTWELLRSCSKIGHSITGGFSKLLSTFIKAEVKEGETILTYCDNSLFNGSGYITSGFESRGFTSPSYKYTKHHKTIESRFMYQKHLLPKRLENFDPNLTEWENMQNNGYDRIWDCGTQVFVWKK